MTAQVAKVVEVGKIDEVVGFSKESWQDAAQETVTEAKKLQDSMYAAVSNAKKRARVVRVIKGLEVKGMFAKVDPNTSNITQYLVCMKLVYGTKHRL